MPLLPTLDDIIAIVIQNMQKERLDLRDHVQTDTKLKQHARAFILSIKLEQSFTLQVSNAIDELKTLYTDLRQQMQDYPWLELNENTLTTLEQQRRQAQERVKAAIGSGKLLSHQIEDIELELEANHGSYSLSAERLQALNTEILNSQSAYPQITPELMKPSNDVALVRRYLVNQALQLMQSAQASRERLTKLITQARVQNKIRPNKNFSEGADDIPSIKKYYTVLCTALKTRKRLEEEQYLLNYIEHLKTIKISFDIATEKATNELQRLNHTETTIKALLNETFQQNPHQMLKLQRKIDALLKQLDQDKIHTPEQDFKPTQHTGVTTLGHFATKHQDPEQVTDLTDTPPAQPAVH